MAFLGGLDPLLVLVLFLVALVLVIAGVAITTWMQSRSRKPPDDTDSKS
jgi:hypothetical protein